jgi:hypothetical protein
LELSGFRPYASHCLRQLDLALKLEKVDFADKLIRLLRHAIDLQPFERGLKECFYLLRLHKSVLNIRHLKESMTGKYEDHFVELMQYLILDGAPESTIGSVEPELTFVPLRCALAELWERKQGADFEICIGESYSIKCHSFLLYARWPYFRRMMQAGMRESLASRLELPEMGKDGGVDPKALEMALELIYKGYVQYCFEFTTEVAIHLLSSSKLYFESHDTESSLEVNVFGRLISYAELKIIGTLDLDNCVETFKLALQLGVQSVIEASKAMIVKNFRDLMIKYDKEDDIRDLPADAREDILWRVCKRAHDIQ